MDVWLALRAFAVIEPTGVLAVADAEVRAWVVATLFESAVTVYRLSGQSLEWWVQVSPVRR